jgi:hypothetical protein
VPCIRGVVVISGTFVASYRAERALLANGQVAWAVVGAGDYVMHREGCLFLAGLRDAGRAYNTERAYASRVALYLSYCAYARISWSAPRRRHRALLPRSSLRTNGL